MNLGSEQVEFRAPAGFVGRIPVRNLWLLMLYASELIRQLPATRKVAFEENPDDIPDLIGEILVRAVEQRIRRNLTLGYVTRLGALPRLRGRIDFLQTERRQLLRRGLIACRFEEFTLNTARNRFVRAALETLARIVRRQRLAHQCRSLARRFERLGVIGAKPQRNEMNDRLGHHDAHDQHMLAAARLAFELALPTEVHGNEPLKAPDRELVWLRRLYEKAVAGFYDVLLSAKGWRVEAGTSFRWPTSEPTPGIGEMLPVMRTDIVLIRPARWGRIIIDTKFNSIVTQGWHRDVSLRSGYIYQLYAYLRSQ